MKNTFISKNFYVISFLMALVLLGAYIYLNHTNSDNNINVSENNVEIEKIISQKSEQTLSNPKIEEDQNNLLETDKIQDSQPKEIRIVAEEILYPDEYDFGEVSDVVKVVSTPIKIDVSSLLYLNNNDSIILELEGKYYEKLIKSVKNNIFLPEETDSGLEEKNIYFDSNYDEYSYNINGRVSYNENGVVDGKIVINNKLDTITILIHSQVALYYYNNEWHKEFYKQGHKID